MTLVDTNVFLDIWYDDPEWKEWSRTAIDRAAARGPLVVSPIILAELAPRFHDEATLVAKLDGHGATLLPLPISAAWHAGKALQATESAAGPGPRHLRTFSSAPTRWPRGGRSSRATPGDTARTFRK